MSAPFDLNDDVNKEGCDGQSFHGSVSESVEDSCGLGDEDAEQDVVGALSDAYRNEITDGIVIPYVGLVFKSPEMAYQFYKDYSCRLGFGITRRSSHNFHDIKYDVTFSCNKNRACNTETLKEGFARRNRGIAGTGCRAKIVVRDRSLIGNWAVTEVVLEHNHELYPDSVRLMRCHRSLPEFVKKQLEINEHAGLAQNKSFNTIFTQSGGITRCMFTERDMRNYISEFRRLQLSEGDAAALMKYFHQQQIDCPNFFYSCDIGDDGRLRSVFWADGRSRSAFKYFGDVITFDTTYLTNRYRMPFAVFVGVNHHGQSILLGCALLANEWYDTYVWLFSAFLVCMHGQHPRAMITDQCSSICGAVAHVFPECRHLLCLWHIMKKFPEKLGGIKDRERILQESSRIVYDSSSESDFESKWLAMMSRYNFGVNTAWFVGLFDMRSRWVPVFVRCTFWAGMSTTQRSESMNAFFDGYVNSRTSLKCFVEKYNLALYAKWEKEKQEDFRSSYRKVRFVSNLNVEIQFAESYTHKMFYVFQKEIKLLIGCTCDFVCTVDGVMTFQVCNKDICGRNYNVRFDSVSGDYECDCRSFEFRGIVCVHGLCAYKQVGIDKVPDKYVLPRWRKDFVRSHVQYNVLLPPVHRDIDRYDHLYSNVQQVILELVEIGCRDKALGQKLLAGLSTFGREFAQSSVCESENDGGKGDSVGLSDGGSVKDPYVVSSKGRPRSVRLRGGVEKKCRRGARQKKPATDSSVETCAVLNLDSLSPPSIDSTYESEMQLDLSNMGARDLLKHFERTC